MGQLRAAREGSQRLGETAAQGVDAPQGLLGLVVEGLAVALGMLPPVALALPGGGAELPEEEIVFQLVALLGRKAGEARAHIACHVVHVPAAGDDLVGGGDQRGQRLGEQLASARGVERHAVVGEDALERAPVILEAAHSHGDVAPAAAFFPHELDRARGGQLALGHEIRRGRETELRTLSRPDGGGIAEKVIDEEFERVALVSADVHALDLHAAAELLRVGDQTPRGRARKGEDLIRALQLVERETDCHLRPRREQHADDRLLLAREVDKAVDVNAVAFSDAARGKLFGKQVEPVGGIGAAVGDHGVVAFEHESHVPELLGERALGLRGGGEEHLGRDRGALALVHGGKQGRLQLGLPRGGAVELQARGDLGERQRHAQQPPALVEPGRGRAALLLQHTAGKTREAEDLGVERETVAAARAELSFRLVAVLLGHDEHAAAETLFHGLGQLGDDGRGLARAGPADDQSEHPLHAPFPKLFLLNILPNPRPRRKGKLKRPSPRSERAA